MRDRHQCQVEPDGPPGDRAWKDGLGRSHRRDRAHGAREAGRRNRVGDCMGRRLEGNESRRDALRAWSVDVKQHWMVYTATIVVAALAGVLAAWLVRS